MGPAALSLFLAFGGLQSPDADAEQHIYGGGEVDSCGWPSTVHLQNSGGGACTGTLIHPLIVLTAAHCISNDIPTAVTFGEAAGGTSLAQTAYCKQGPGWNGETNTGQDYGYCKLKSPVTNVEIIPVAAGCEQSAIQPGARIMHVGYGVDENGQGGRKKMLDTTINNITGQGELISGMAGSTICNGDSGGPTFVYLDPALGGDGTWRVAAIHSWAQGADPVDPNCNGVAGSVLVSQAIDWIEEDSEVDITPCTDGDAWAPTAHCGGVPTSPWLGEGSYAMGCSSADVVEFAGICGDPLDANPDETPPVVQVLTPENAVELSAVEGAAEVEIEVDATDEGWGIATVELTVRSVTLDQEQLEERNEWEPWSFAASLPEGSWEVTAVAIDYAGNESEPVTVCFGVGEPGCDYVGADDGTGDGDGDDDDDDGTAGPVDGDDDDDDEGTGGDGGGADGDDGGGGGCSCRTIYDGDDGGPASLLMLLAVGGLVRRRRAAAG